MTSRWHAVGPWVHWPSLALLALAVGALVACTAVAQKASLAWLCGLGGGLLLAAFVGFPTLGGPQNQFTRRVGWLGVTGRWP